MGTGRSCIDSIFAVAIKQKEEDCLHYKDRFFSALLSKIYTKIGWETWFAQIQPSKKEKLRTAILPMLGVHPFFAALTQDGIRSNAIKMGVCLIERLECIAAGSLCPTSTLMDAFDGCSENPPVLFAVKYALLIAKLMRQSPSSHWPEKARHIVYRYLPIMEVMQDGQNEEFINDIKQGIPEPTNSESEALPTASPTFPVAVQMRAKQRRKKRGRKKGRKR